MIIKITELDELLNTLATSALEPHEEYKMEFSNREQKLIYEYIKSLQQENQQLKEQLHQSSLDIQELTEQTIDCPSYCDKLKQRDEVINEAIELIETQMYIMTFGEMRNLATKEDYERLLEILQKYKGDNK